MARKMEEFTGVMDVGLVLMWVGHSVYIWSAISLSGGFSAAQYLLLWKRYVLRRA